MRRKVTNILGGMAKKKKLFKAEKRKEQKILLIAGAMLTALIVLFVLGIVFSTNIKTQSYIIEYGNLPSNFDGYKIVQITDYHKRVYANDNKTLAEDIKALEPDIIVMTGDLIDSGAKDIENPVDLMERLAQISDVVWIKGNHFYKTDQQLAKELQEKMDGLGVISLINECYTVEKDGQNILFCGVDDPEKYFAAEKLPQEYVSAASQNAMVRFLDETEKSAAGMNGFKVLLSHRYSMYYKFPEYGYSLTLAGHSHGGQLKLPGGFDLIGYNLKLFPKVKSGYNDINGMPLIVSSGLGVSNLNLRLYNPAEIVLIELKSK